MFARSGFVVRLPKIAQRYQLIGIYKHVTKNKYLPYGKLFLTLGGRCADEYGELLPESELATLMDEEFLNADQYVSVERKLAVVKANDKLKVRGPKWIYGNIKDLARFRELDRVAIVNADLMVGPEKALEERIPQNIAAAASPGTLIHLNLIASNRWAESNGKRFSDGLSARPALMENPEFAKLAKRMTLCYDGLYESKPEGSGSRVTRMSSLIYEKR